MCIFLGISCMFCICCWLNYSNIVPYLRILYKSLWCYKYYCCISKKRKHSRSECQSTGESCTIFAHYRVITNVDDRADIIVIDGLMQEKRNSIALALLALTHRYMTTHISLWWTNGVNFVSSLLKNYVLTLCVGLTTFCRNMLMPCLHMPWH